MPVLTQEQMDNLLRIFASGISEVDVPGGQRIKYSDPKTLAQVLASASVLGAEEQAGAFRTFATFYRDK